jgi:AcrR family transcriptional regulator
MTSRPAMPTRPLRADARRNYLRLLVEARAAVSEHGTQASLEDIARRADVGIGTLYRHFPTRQALLEAVLRDRFDTLGARAEELLSHPSPGQALAAWLRTFIVGATTYTGLAASLAAALHDEQSELHASCHGMRAAGQALFDRAQRSGAIRPDADATDVFILANAIAWAAEQVHDRTGLDDRLLSLALDGLHPQTVHTGARQSRLRGPDQIS